MSYDSLNEWGRRSNAKSSRAHDRDISQILVDSPPWSITQTGLVKLLGGNSDNARGVIHTMLAMGQMAEEASKAKEGDRWVKRKRIGFPKEMRGRSINGVHVPIDYGDPVENEQGILK